MGNLLFTDPSFTPTNFEPWVADEAKSKNKQVKAYAKSISAMWKQGIESHHQDSERVEKFDRIDKTIYTPGSSAGVSVNVLSSLDAPPAEIMEDTDSFASYLKSTVSSLLSLIGIEADPVDSKEYILLAQLISSAWMDGDSLSLEFHADYLGSGSGSVIIADSEIDTNGGDFTASGVGFSLSRGGNSSDTIETAGGDVLLTMTGAVTIAAEIDTNGGNFTVAGSSSFDNTDSNGDIGTLSADANAVSITMDAAHRDSANRVAEVGSRRPLGSGRP